MNRLNFVLPEWTRVAWSSQVARQVWEPRVQRVAGAWERVERLAVASDAKPSALQNVRPEDLPGRVTEAARLGIVALPLGRVASGGLYSAASRPVGDGPWSYRVAFTTPDRAATWGEAWSRSDDEAIGQLLGFPACCRDFFGRYWAGQRRVDLTYAATADAGGDVTGPPEANILGRWLGVRLVSHMPCSFGCQASAEIGRRLHEVFTEDDPEVAAWCLEMLSWPAEWTALHGIAEIKTPIWRVSTRTDATADRLEVRYRGARYPVEGASGNAFPFERRPTVIPMTSLRSYTRAFEDERAWTENGFLSKAAMEAAHAAVASVAPQGDVLDLGCGNGRLARHIAGARDAVGVDVNRPHRHTLDEFIHADIANVALWSLYRRYTTLLMPGRLVEMSSNDAALVHLALTGEVVVYAYGDWLTKYGSLRALCEAAGLRWNPTAEASGDGVAAALLMVN
jgi:hypothetical protein